MQDRELRSDLYSGDGFNISVIFASVLFCKQRAAMIRFLPWDHCHVSWFALGITHWVLSLLSVLQLQVAAAPGGDFAPFTPSTPNLLCMLAGPFSHVINSQLLYLNHPYLPLSSSTLPSLWSARPSAQCITAVSLAVFPCCCPSVLLHVGRVDVSLIASSLTWSSFCTFSPWQNGSLKICVFWKVFTSSLLSLAKPCWLNYFCEMS